MRVAFSTLGRVSIENIQRALSNVVTFRQQVATGRKFHLPSQDPIGAQRSVALSNELSNLEQYKDASQSALMFLESAESALMSIGEYLREAKSIGLSQRNATADSSTREATAVAIRSIRDQIVILMNTKTRGRYLFGGHRTTTEPFFENSAGAIEYRGDQGVITFRVGPNQFEVTNIPGSEISGTTDAFLRSTVDLTPIVTGATQLSALNRGSGIDEGQFQIEDGSGNTFVVDTTGLSTVQDVIDQINTSGIDVGAQINADQTGIDLVAINPGDTITVTELNDGTTAYQLGLEGSGVGTLSGDDVDPALEMSTSLAEIPGLTLPLGSIRVFTGAWSGTVDFSTPPAATIGDLVSRFNSTVPGVTMSLSTDGTTIDIRGTGPFSIENNGPDTTAEQLGIAGVGQQARLFGVLETLEQALRDNDGDAIEDALFELERVMENVVGVQGVMASRAERVDTGISLLDTYHLNAESRLSDVQSVEMAEAITQLSEAQTIYQTALATASSVFDMSLLNYLYR